MVSFYPNLVMNTFPRNHNPTLTLNPFERFRLRLRLGLRLRILLCTVWGVSLSVGVAQETNSIIESWLNSQKQLQSWHADFVQTRTLKTLKQPLVSTGHVWFLPPNQFRWELGKPPQTIALRQTQQMFVIYPHMKRAERYPLTGVGNQQWRDVLSLLEAGFPKDREELTSKFKIGDITKTNDVWEISLQPLSAAARRMLREIRLGVSAENHSLLSTEMIFADNSSMKNTFTNPVINEGISREIFEWKTPDDFKLTEPLKQ
jgi:outer membrane lipoprotein-sorting protein